MNHVRLIGSMLSIGLLHWFVLLLIMSGDIETNPGPNNRINCFLLNTRSVKSVDKNRNKLVELQSLASLKESKIICLTETWLNNEIIDSEILPSENFIVYRKDRIGTGGGVLTAVHSSFISKLRQDLAPADTGNSDILVVEIIFPKQPKTVLVNIYNPPGNTNNALYLRNTLKAAFDAGFRCLHVMGDFNLPNLDMTTGLPTNASFACYDFYDVFQDFNLSHLVDFPSHKQGNRLDLILSTHPEFFFNIDAEEDAFPSDHFLINFTMDFKATLDKAPRSVFNYKKADWDGLRTALRAANLQELINTRIDNVSLACSTWTSKVIEIAKLFIPKIRLKNPNSPPWIDGEILLLSRKKERLRRKALQSNNPNTWAAYRRARNKLRSLVNKKYDHYVYESFSGNSENMKRFWGLVRSKCKNKTTPPRVSYNDRTESTPLGKAKLFNSFFHSNFSANTNIEPPEINSFVNPDLVNVQLDVVDIRLLLTTIDIKKTSGPDELSGRILRECAAELAPSLTIIFNLSLSSGTVPESWKRANVTPVFKKGDKEMCSNYRPISLLTVASKVLERALLNKIFLYFSHLITDAQHGFVRGRSTVTQLFTVFHDINKYLDSGQQTDVIYLDFSKAFDSVPHKLLTLKLKTFGFSGNLLNWFSSYLFNRRQRVVIDGTASDWLPVASGVPQGSILGPILFLLYTNDLGSNLSQGTSIALYADDAKIFRPILSAYDCRMLQADLHRLENWSGLWKLSFNTAKCKILSFYRSPHFSFPYCLNNDTLTNITEFNDLGVNVSKNFSWKLHIRTIVSKAQRLMGLIKRTLGFNAPQNAKLLLYNSLVRPTLTYASVVWNPDKGDLTLLERVQRRATKYILNDYTSDYKIRLSKIGLIPLCYYFEIIDLCFFYKCIHGFYNLNLSNLIPFRDISVSITRSGQDSLLLQALPFRTETAAGFFSHRIVKLWNNLPQSIRTIVCIDKKITPFRTKIHKYYFQKLSTHFDPDNTCTWVGVCRCASCRPT